MVTCGMKGDISRGNASAVGLSIPAELSRTSLLSALGLNGDCRTFRLKVNAFGGGLAQKVVDYAKGHPRYEDVNVEVITNTNLGRDEWLLEPIGE